MNEEYRKLVIEILSDGTWQDGRNGMQKIIPHYSFTINDMEKDHKLTLRKMYYKGVLGEFKTLISPTPLTNVSQFEENGCNYWKEWSGNKGELNLDYWNKMHPQLEEIIEQIKIDPHSRRHVISLWDHKSVTSGELSLACCWHGLTFSVIDDTLHLVWQQRSVDTMVGLPSDVYLAFLFMNHISVETGHKVGSCMFSLSNVHIYAEMEEAAYEILKRNENDGDKPLKGLVIKP